jgi:ribosomal protein S18 acetylase RimI-like enzyme
MIEPVRLPPDRLPEAVAVLARSFHTEPNLAHILPDERARARALPAMFAASCRDALPLGHVYGMMLGERVAGVAIWMPPGAYPLSPWRQLRALPDGLRVFAAAPRSFPPLMRFASATAGMHPTERHWYLETVGVEPGLQGQGIGSGLLQPVLAQADARGEPCYLETASERNVAWYRHLGFEVMRAEVSFFPGGPPSWTMLRPAGRR